MRAPTAMFELTLFETFYENASFHSFRLLTTKSCPGARASVLKEYPRELQKLNTFIEVVQNTIYNIQQNKIQYLQYTKFNTRYAIHNTRHTIHKNIKINIRYAVYEVQTLNINIHTIHSNNNVICICFQSLICSWNHLTLHALAYMLNVRSLLVTLLMVARSNIDRKLISNYASSISSILWM